MEPSPRRAGLLLHPTSLPGPYGMGDIGPSTLDWIDALAAAKQTLWQTLPLGPTGYGDSPYQCFSTFAGNPYLISPEGMVEDGVLDPSDLEPLPAGSPLQIDYGRAIAYKHRLLARACARYRAGRLAPLRDELMAFRHQARDWLEDYALFAALKRARNGEPWSTWGEEIASRKRGAIRAARAALQEAVEDVALEQFLFFRQWARVREHAQARGVGIIGDLSLFVAFDSADVWAHPANFELAPGGAPIVVAGVPPDYFSPTGQLWGNPLYNWNTLRADRFRWWIERVRSTLTLCDWVRIDHFRGLSASWEVPYGSPTAEHGRWVKAPGSALLATLREALGDLPLIAEDLGVITADVVALRRRFKLPGMRVLQFAFDGQSGNPFLPHNYDTRTVVYTGTHDNDTTRGWYAQTPPDVQDRVRRYLGRDGSDIAWDFIRLAWSSVAEMALVPLQDVLDLGSEARMNYPGRGAGNWTWRFRWEQLTAERLGRLADLTEVYARIGEVAPAAPRVEDH